jgi:hypothetical protein
MDACCHISTFDLRGISIYHVEAWWRRQLSLHGFYLIQQEFQNGYFEPSGYGANGRSVRRYPYRSEKRVTLKIHWRFPSGRRNNAILMSGIKSWKRKLNYE